MSPVRPEVLAPAGDPTALAAALAAGADAVYFGLDEGFNARARARNFPLEELPATVARIHRAGARAYLTTNTLVFEPELAHAERMLEAVARAGVDAIIVQDPAIALLARAICPALEVHASTQMSITSPAAAAFATELGATRVVVPRELSVEEIRAFRAGTDVELEVFVHGALCVSWSGQCLTSEAWGGRSANRGQCAQSCRMPYDWVVDGEVRPTGEVKYLLSPKDLLGASALPQLAEIGVHGLKIEGRQKSATYVSTAVAAYRRWRDEVGRDEAIRVEGSDELRAMSLAYSRGFSPGFFEGSDHQELVDGRFPKSRGLFVGQVVRVRGSEVDVAAEGELSLRAGMGLVFDGGRPQEKEPGGPLFRVERAGGLWKLGFGKPGPDLSHVAAGDRVWVTSDPVLQRATERSIEGEPEGRVPVVLTVRGALGEPLVVEAVAGHARAEARTGALAEARGEGLGEAVLRDKLGSMGGTPLRVSALDASGLPAGLHVPPSELKAARRTLVEALLPQIERGPERVVAEGALARTRAELSAVPDKAPVAAHLVPLCRTDAQLAAVIDAGLPEVELDWMELVGLGRAVNRARDAGLKVTVATLRVTKPGEEAMDDRVWRLEPDGILLRHWGAFERFVAKRDQERPDLVLHGDFALNVTNGLTARHLLRRGLDTVTASFDLDERQLDAMVDASPRGAVSVVVYHRMPTFYTEHCLYAHLLSEGRDFRTCGRPCEAHEASIRDHMGREHPVLVDAGCRNTVFDHRTQSAARALPYLLEHGVARLRVLFVRESREQARAVLEAHRALLAGELSGDALVKRLGLWAQVGVAEGGMSTLA